jgi:hypothetical protein
MRMRIKSDCSASGTRNGGCEDLNADCKKQEVNIVSLMVASGLRIV